MLAGPKLESMKSIIAVLLLSVVCALGQSNTNTIAKPDLDGMKAELQKQIEAAQQRAREREAMAATSAPVQVTDRVEPIFKSVKPYYDTNRVSKTLGVLLMGMEDSSPGVSTNFTAEQRAIDTNRPIIRATLGADGKIVYLSTNYVDAVTGKLTTNKPAADQPKPNP